jgi:hypothetical protein
MKIIDYYYQEGDFTLSQGAPGKQVGKVEKKGDVKKTNRGNGWYENKTPSKLSVIVDNEGKKEKINIEDEFHENIGRITQKRLTKLDQLKGKDIKNDNGRKIEEVIIDELKKKIK